MKPYNIFMSQVLLMPLICGPLLVALVGYVTAYHYVEPLLVCQDIISNLISVVFMMRFCRRRPETLAKFESVFLLLALAGASYILRPVLYEGLAALDIFAILFALQLVLSLFAYPLTGPGFDIAGANNLLLHAFMAYSYSHIYMPTGSSIPVGDDDLTGRILSIAAWGWTMSSYFLKLSVVLKCIIDEYAQYPHDEFPIDSEKVQVPAKDRPLSALEEGLRYALLVALFCASSLEIGHVVQRL